MNNPEVLSLTKRALIFVAAFSVMFAATLAWTLNRKGSLGDPPAPWNVDGVFYDNIAWNLNAGNGIFVDLQAGLWRHTYFLANKRPEYQGKYGKYFPLKGTGPTAMRSPAYPFILSTIYQPPEHQFAFARIAGCVFVSLGLALLLTFCVNRWGFLPAVVAGSTLVIDYSVMRSAGVLATECLAILVVAITFVLVARAAERPNHLRWFAAGIAFATLMLTRGIWSLGLLILIFACFGFLIPRIRRLFTGIKPARFGTFLITAMIVASPWWIRNCMVTGSFTPFGTAGSCGFVAAYCDESLADYGQWQQEVFKEHQRAVQQTVDMDTIVLADLEVMIGKSSMRKTWKWIAANWSRLPELGLYRALSHWGFFNPAVPPLYQGANILLVIFGIAGCVFCTGNFRGVFACVLVLDTLLIVLTWEHLGRYGIPIRPIVHLGFGLAVASVIRSSFPHFQRESNTVSTPSEVANDRQQLRE